VFLDVDGFCKPLFIESSAKTNLILTQPSEDYRLIQQFQLTNWPGSQPVPHARNSVLRVVQLTNNWQNERAQSGERGRALVHCV